MWVIKCHCGTSVPGDTQSSAAQPHVGGPALLGGLRTHRCPSGLAILGVWGLLWSCDTHTDLHPKSISSSPFYSPEMPPLSEWQHSFIWETGWLSVNAAHKIIVITLFGGEWGLKLIYLDLSEPAKEFKLFTYTHKKPVHWKLQGAAKFSLKTDMEID